MDKREFNQRALGAAGKLHRIAYAILMREADCEDAVQEALLRAWAQREALRQPEFFETWLTRILINVSRSLLKKRGSRRETELADTIPAPKPRDMALHEALCRLDGKLRLPLVMQHIEGYSVQEISEMLKLPRSTVKWRLHAARQKLRETLTEGDEGT